jgi:hypothetical protein
MGAWAGIAIFGSERRLWVDSGRWVMWPRMAGAGGFATVPLSGREAG